jgi:hypothetical protein
MRSFWAGHFFSSPYKTAFKATRTPKRQKPVGQQQQQQVKRPTYAHRYGDGRHTQPKRAGDTQRDNKKKREPNNVGEMKRYSGLAKIDWGKYLGPP